MDKEHKNSEGSKSANNFIIISYFVLYLQLGLNLFSIFATLGWVERIDVIYLSTLILLLFPSITCFFKSRKLLIFFLILTLALFLIYVIRWDENFMIKGKRIPVDLLNFFLSFLFIFLRFRATSLPN
jgi:hypothetical protein